MEKEESAVDAIKKFMELMEREKLHVFSQETAHSLEEFAKEWDKNKTAYVGMVKFWNAISGIGYMGTVLKSFVGWAIVMIGGIIAAKNGLAAWIIGLLSSSGG